MRWEPGPKTTARKTLAPRRRSLSARREDVLLFKQSRRHTQRCERTETTGSLLVEQRNPKYASSHFHRGEIGKSCKSLIPPAQKYSRHVFHLCSHHATAYFKVSLVQKVQISTRNQPTCWQKAERTPQRPCLQLTILSSSLFFNFVMAEAQPSVKFQLIAQTTNPPPTLYYLPFERKEWLEFIFPQERALI